MTFLTNNLKALRIDKKITQREMAELLAMTERNYVKYERGEIDIPASKLIQLADFFHTSIDNILGRTRTDNPETNKAVPLEPEEGVSDG